MSFLAKVAKTIFGIYGVIMFFVAMFISCCFYVLIFMFVDKSKAPHIAHRLISRRWARSLFVFYGIRLVVKDKELLDQKQTYVFMSNHRSLLDIPGIACSTKHTIRFLAKVELMKIPLLGYVIRKLYVPVDRKNKAARAKSMENMMNSIKEGISVVIYPEGTRNKDNINPLLPFHDGAFRLAIQSQVPLAILAVKNSENLLSPVNAFQLSPGTLTCQWCKPISTIGMTQDDLPRLKEMAAKELLQYLA